VYVFAVCVPQVQRSKMAAGSKAGSQVNSKKTSSCVSPSLKSKNFFTRYVDILNCESNQSPAVAAASSVPCYDSVSNNSFVELFFLTGVCLHSSIILNALFENLTEKWRRSRDGHIPPGPVTLLTI